MQVASSHVGSSNMMDLSNIGVRVESLHVNSAILAEKSAFFRKVRINLIMFTTFTILPFFFLMSFYGG
jgi:hypothetical protein